MDLNAIIDQMTAVSLESSIAIRAAITRIHQLEAALTGMVETYETVRDDTEGEHPSPDPGCIDCTVGCVPVKYNTGRCAYHRSKELLGLS